MCRGLLQERRPEAHLGERFIQVEGEVRRAGRQSWTNDMRLSAAVELAGGFTKSADATHVTIHHFNGGATPASYVAATNSPSQDPFLLRGDRIVVARRGPTIRK